MIAQTTLPGVPAGQDFASIVAAIEEVIAGSEFRVVMRGDGNGFWLLDWFLHKGVEPNIFGAYDRDYVIGYEGGEVTWLSLELDETRALLPALDRALGGAITRRIQTRIDDAPRWALEQAASAIARVRDSVEEDRRLLDLIAAG